MAEPNAAPVFSTDITDQSDTEGAGRQPRRRCDRCRPRHPDLQRDRPARWRLDQQRDRRHQRHPERHLVRHLQRGPSPSATARSPIPTASPGRSPNVNPAPVFRTDITNQSDDRGHSVSARRRCDRCRPRHPRLLRHRPARGVSINSSTGVISGTLSTDELGHPQRGHHRQRRHRHRHRLASPGPWPTPTRHRSSRTDIADQSDTEGDTVSLDADATDADLDTLVYSATGLPGGMSINSSTGVISGTLDRDQRRRPQRGHHRQRRHRSPTPTRFTWTVVEPEPGPGLLHRHHQPVRHRGRHVVSLDADATDADLDTLDLQRHRPPGGVTINSSTGVIAAPSADQLRRRTTWSSPSATAPPPTPTPFTWTVANANQAPVFRTDITDQSDTEGHVVSLDADATDADLDTLDLQRHRPARRRHASTAQHRCHQRHADRDQLRRPQRGHHRQRRHRHRHRQLHLDRRQREPGPGLQHRHHQPVRHRGRSRSASTPTRPMPISTPSSTAPPACPAASRSTAAPVSSGAPCPRPARAYHTWSSPSATAPLTDTDTFTWTVANAEPGPGLQHRHHRPVRHRGRRRVARRRCDRCRPRHPRLLGHRPARRRLDQQPHRCHQRHPQRDQLGRPQRRRSPSPTAPPPTPTASPGPWPTPNQAPVFSTDITNQSDTEGEAVSLDADATDADLDTLVYSATGLPDGVSINSQHGCHHRHPQRDQLRRPQRRHHRQRRHRHRYRSVHLDGRQPEPGPGLQHRHRQPVRRRGRRRSASTPMRPMPTSTRSPTAPPACPAASRSTASTGVISGTLTATSSGVHNVVITVSDGTATDTDSFTWTVANANQAPGLQHRHHQPVRRRGRTSSASTPMRPMPTSTPSPTAPPACPAASRSTAAPVSSAAPSTRHQLGRPQRGHHRQRRHDTDTDPFTWTVANPNQAPVFSTDIANQSDTEGDGGQPRRRCDRCRPRHPRRTAPRACPAASRINSSTGVISGTLSRDQRRRPQRGHHRQSTAPPPIPTASPGPWPTPNQAPVFSTDITNQSDTEGDSGQPRRRRDRCRPRHPRLQRHRPARRRSRSTAAPVSSAAPSARRARGTHNVVITVVRRHRHRYRHLHLDRRQRQPGAGLQHRHHQPVRHRGPACQPRRRCDRCRSRHPRLQRHRPARRRHASTASTGVISGTLARHQLGCPQRGHHRQPTAPPPTPTLHLDGRPNRRQPGPGLQHRHHRPAPTPRATVGQPRRRCDRCRPRHADVQRHRPARRRHASTRSPGVISGTLSGTSVGRRTRPSSPSATARSPTPTASPGPVTGPAGHRHLCQRHVQPDRGQQLGQRPDRWRLHPDRHGRRLRRHRQRRHDQPARAGAHPAARAGDGLGPGRRSQLPGRHRQGRRRRQPVHLRRGPPCRATDAYRVKVRIATNGAVFVRASQVISNAETAIGAEVLVPGLTHTPGDFIRVRAQLERHQPDDHPDPGLGRRRGTEPDHLAVHRHQLGGRPPGGRRRRPPGLHRRRHHQCPGPRHLRRLPGHEPRWPARQQAPVFSTDSSEPHRRRGRRQSARRRCDRCRRRHPRLLAPRPARRASRINSTHRCHQRHAQLDERRRPHVVITVSDGSLTDTDRFTWTVTDANQAPVLQHRARAIQPMPRATVISLDADATDADLATPSSTRPRAAQWHHDQLEHRRRQRHAVGHQLGRLHDRRDRVSDGTLTDTDSFTWTVTEPAANGARLQHRLHRPHRCRGRRHQPRRQCVDPNGDTLVYSATSLPNGITINSSTGVISRHAVGTSSGVYSHRHDRQRRHAHRHRQLHLDGHRAGRAHGVCQDTFSRTWPTAGAAPPPVAPTPSRARPPTTTSPAAPARSTARRGQHPQRGPDDRLAPRTSTWASGSPPTRSRSAAPSTSTAWPAGSAPRPYRIKVRLAPGGAGVRPGQLRSRARPRPPSAARSWWRA